jgi:hypothetical protein
MKIHKMKVHTPFLKGCRYSKSYILDRQLSHVTCKRCLNILAKNGSVLRKMLIPDNGARTLLHKSGAW